MISVLLTTYNGAAHVLEQLESIKNQTRPVDEVVISDDLSTDGTVDLIQRFIEQNSLKGWVLHVNAKNLGPALNSFRLLRLASGEVVFLADQDDVWEPKKVEVMTDLLEHFPELSAVASTEALIDGSGEPITDEAVLRGFGRNVTSFDGCVDLAWHDFLGASSIPWHATCIRRSVIDQILAGDLPEVGRSLGADWFVGLVATLSGRFCQLGEPLIRRRVHGSNASLGRLRKTTLLSADNERRSEVLGEIGRAHRFLLQEPSLGVLLSDDQRHDIEKVVRLFERRVDFARGPSLTRWARLGGNLGAYRMCYGSWKATLRMWITDLLYAYRINWAKRR